MYTAAEIRTHHPLPGRSGNDDPDRFLNALFSRADLNLTLVAQSNRKTPPFAKKISKHRERPSTCECCILGTAVPGENRTDRKSTRLNSSHIRRSYADCCLKTKK